MSALPLISMIVAASADDIIGRDGALPWQLTADLQRFKALTLGKPVIMGRRTWQSIGKPLPGRTNIVISRSASLGLAGAVVARDLTTALAAAGEVPEVMIIGGAEIYALAFPYVRRIYLTRVHGNVDGAIRMPPLDLTRWQEVSRTDQSTDERNSHASSYFVLERSGESLASIN